MAEDPSSDEKAYEVELERTLSLLEDQKRGGGSGGTASDLLKVAAGAALGAALTFLVQWGQSRQETVTKRLESQISKLYAPLSVYATASNVTWSEFHRENRLNYSDPGYSPSADDVRLYRVWMSSAMVRIASKAEDLIIENAGLILHDVMPDRFKQWIIFTEAYRSKVASWRADDDKREGYTSAYSNVVFINYPDLAPCASEQLAALTRLRDDLRRRIFWLQAPDPPLPASCSAVSGVPLDDNP